MYLLSVVVYDRFPLVFTSKMATTTVLHFLDFPVMTDLSYKMYTMPMTLYVTRMWIPRKVILVVSTIVAGWLLSFCWWTVVIARSFKR